MRAGLLNNLVEVLFPTNSRDPAGAEFTEWKPSIPPLCIWMAFDPEYGSIQNSQGREIDPQSVRFRCRYRDDIDSTMRLRLDGEDYKIDGKPKLRGGRKRELLISAKAVTDGG